MSLFGRALSGAGAGAADIASKYIDEEIWINKSQAVEDMRVQTAQRIDAMMNDPTRRANLRAEAVKDVGAEGEARNEVALRGKRAEATDTVLQKAEIDNAAARAVAEATARGTTLAELEMKYGNDPRMLSAIRKKAQAGHVESAASVASAELTRMSIDERKRLNGLYDDLAAIENDPKMTPEQKMVAAKPKITQINVIKARNAQATPRDSKYEYTENVTETVGKDGSTTKTTTYTPRAQAQDAAKPAGIDMKLLQDELARQAEQKKASNARPLVERAAERAANADPIRSADTRVLRRIAAIDGHQQQRAAKEELRRREEEASQVDTSGQGFGNYGG